MRPEQVNDLDELVAHARVAEPRALDELEIRRMARAALARAEDNEPFANDRKVPPRRLGWPLLAAMAMAVLLGFYARSTPSLGTAIEVGRNDLALRLALRAGDTVIAAPDTALRIVAQEPSARRVQVEHGTTLFDVVPLAAGQSFEVRTEHLQLHVLGTVFTVEVTGQRSIVRVYEGRVFVAGRTLRTGDVWASSGPLPSPYERAPLAREAAQHARLRQIHEPDPQTVQLARPPKPRTTALPEPESFSARVGADASATARVFAEATRRLYNLNDARGALELLDTYDLDAENGPLRERASVLRVDALLKLGRAAQAAEVARRYVLREPETHTSARMREIAKGLVLPVTERE